MGNTFSRKFAQVPVLGYLPALFAWIKGDKRRARELAGICNASMVTVMEYIPILGYALAAYHYFQNGDSDKAKRAAARCTGATVACAVGIALSFAAGPLGVATGLSILEAEVVMGAIAGLPAGILQTTVEGLVADKIQDPEIRKGCVDLKDPADWLFNIVFSILGGAVGGACSGAAATEVVADQFKRAGIEAAESSARVTTRQFMEGFIAWLERAAASGSSSTAGRIPVAGMKKLLQEVTCCLQG